MKIAIMRNKSLVKDVTDQKVQIGLFTVTAVRNEIDL